jgi:predicted CoA-binding protein
MNESGLVRDLLSSTRTIAVFGYSARPDRPSNSVSRTLRAHRYRVIPVNPALRGAIVEGERSYERLVDIPKDANVGFVDIFRRGEYLDAVVDDAIAAGMKATWFQLALGNIAAAERAEAAGMRVVWDRCTAIELRRLERSG